MLSKLCAYAMVLCSVPLVVLPARSGFAQSAPQGSLPQVDSSAETNPKAEAAKAEAAAAKAETKAASAEWKWSRWLNPATAPFIPVPEIAVDPNSGTTVGILPVWLQSDDAHHIRQIIAPDFYWNENFGYGAHARIYDYPSADERWSVSAGLEERVQRGFDAEYEDGRLRQQLWSFSASLIYDRSGSPRFYGIGNNSKQTAETNYTDGDQVAQVQLGYNLNHAWQVQYTLRHQRDDVLPGTLQGIASIGVRFANLLGLGTEEALLNRVAVIYDTRDDLTVPRHGMKWVAYGGAASRTGIFNDSMYSEAGLDGRGFFPIAEGTTFAAHMALRYLPSTNHPPFWALSSLGGDQSEIGGEQPLRGYGEGRFYDRDSFSTTFEVRRTVASFDASATRLDVEVTPFVDLGRVFARTGAFPVEQLHKVGGVGFRGIARPFVVGYVDIGYGSEGIAAFTGLYYPF